jgi:hypothetical protein
MAAGSGQGGSACATAADPASCAFRGTLGVVLSELVA